MAQKRNMIFDSLYGGDINTDDLEFDENASKEKIDDKDDNAQPTKLLKEQDLEINGKEYHISLD